MIVKIILEQPEEKLGKPRQTKASKKSAEAVKEKTKQKTEPKALFKMEKFKKVDPRTNTHLPQKKTKEKEKVVEKKVEDLKKAEKVVTEEKKA